MYRIKLLLPPIAVFFILGLILSGCGLLPEAAPKPENIGPTGEISELKPELSFLEKIRTAPGDIYDLEETAGKLFGQIMKGNWAEAEESFTQLKEVWQKVKSASGNNAKNEPGFKEGDITLDLLANAVKAKKIPDSCEKLNKFMANASKISKTYQLSPVSDLINIGNAVRDLAFHIEDENWKKASGKFNALEDTWNQSKPTLEQMGILGELTKTHLIINQMKDAVDSENKDEFTSLSSDLNQSLSKIRNFFYGR